MNSHQSLLSFEQAESWNSLRKADTFLRSGPSRNWPGHRRFQGKPGVGWRGTGPILSDTRFLEISSSCPWLQSQRSEMKAIDVKKFVQGI